MATKEYINIVFIQNSQDFDDFTDKSTGETGISAFFDADKDEMIEYLMQWEMGDRGEAIDEKPWGASDLLYEKKIGNDNYVMSYNSSLGYAGLTRVEDKTDEEKDLKFSSISEALQHLSDLTNSTIKIAELSGKGLDPDERQHGSTPRKAYERLKDAKENGEEINPEFVKFLEEKIARDGGVSLDYAMMVLKERFKKGERAIATNPDRAFSYIKGLLKLKEELGNSDNESAFNITQSILNAVSKNLKYVQNLSQNDSLEYDDDKNKLVPAKVAAIQFMSFKEAIQHLSDLTGSNIKIAADLNIDEVDEIVKNIRSKTNDNLHIEAIEDLYKFLKNLKRIEIVNCLKTINNNLGYSTKSLVEFEDFMRDEGLESIRKQYGQEVYQKFYQSF